MLIAIDIGNTNIVIGGIQGDAIQFEARIATDRIKTSDQYGVEIKNMLDLFRVPVEEVEDCIISSVVPPVFNAVRTGVVKVTGLEPIVVGPGIKTGLNIQMDAPAQVGSDRIVIAVAALAADSPVGVIFAGIVFGALRAGTMELNRTTSIPVEFVNVIQAMVVILVAAPLLVKELKRLNPAGWSRKTKKEVA